MSDVAEYVQAAVQREDEQIFAALGGSNLMFCEDAAPTVKRTLDDDLRVIDLRVKIRHEESLAPARCRRGDHEARTGRTHSLTCSASDRRKDPP